MLGCCPDYLWLHFRFESSHLNTIWISFCPFHFSSWFGSMCMSECPRIWLFVLSGVAWSPWLPERWSRQNCECCRNWRCTGSACQHTLPVLLWFMGSSCRQLPLFPGWCEASSPWSTALSVPHLMAFRRKCDQMWTYWEDWSVEKVWTRGYSSWISYPYALCHQKPTGSPLSAGAASFD